MDCTTGKPHLIGYLGTLDCFDSIVAQFLSVEYNVATLWITFCLIYKTKFRHQVVNLATARGRYFWKIRIQIWVVSAIKTLDNIDSVLLSRKTFFNSLSRMTDNFQLKGRNSPCFFHCALSKVKSIGLGSEGLSRSEFIEAHLHSIEDNFGRENLVFPSFNFNFKETGEFPPQMDNTFVGALSNHLIGKEGFYRSQPLSLMSQTLSDWVFIYFYQ